MLTIRCNTDPNRGKNDWFWGVFDDEITLVTFGGPCSLSAALAFCKAYEKGTLTYNGWTEDASRYVGKL